MLHFLDVLQHAVRLLYFLLHFLRDRIGPTFRHRSVHLELKKVRPSFREVLQEMVVDMAYLEVDLRQALEVILRLSQLYHQQI